MFCHVFEQGSAKKGADTKAGGHRVATQGSVGAVCIVFAHIDMELQKCQHPFRNGGIVLTVVKSYKFSKKVLSFGKNI